MLRKKKMKLELWTIPLKKLTQNWDYEVISNEIWDNRTAIEYYTIEQAVMDGVDISSDTTAFGEDPVRDYATIGFRYEPNPEVPVHIENAKRSEFGVARILRGRYEGMEFMFPVAPTLDFDVQLLCYGYFTYGYVDQKLIKTLKKENDEIVLNYVAGLAGVENYEEIMGEEFDR